MQTEYTWVHCCRSRVDRSAYACKRQRKAGLCDLFSRFDNMRTGLASHVLRSTWSSRRDAPARLGRYLTLDPIKPLFVNEYKYSTWTDAGMSKVMVCCCHMSRRVPCPKLLQSRHA